MSVTPPQPRASLPASLSAHPDSGEMATPPQPRASLLASLSAHPDSGEMAFPITVAACAADEECKLCTDVTPQRAEKDAFNTSNVHHAHHAHHD